MFDNGLQKVYVLLMTDTKEEGKLETFIQIYRDEETAEKEAERLNDNERYWETDGHFFVREETVRI